MSKRYLMKFTTLDLVIITLLSACGVASKPFVRLLAQIFTGTLIPIGTLAGAIYMLWIVLACSMVKKRGTAILVGIVQAVLVVVFDMLGNRGLANILVYVVPGIVLELGMLLFPAYVAGTFSAFVAGALANASGSAIVGVLFLRLHYIPLFASLFTSAVTGGIGGILAFRLFVILRKLKTAPQA
ncbi:MAG: ECF transporter S component [Clostridia bacterium]|nr:ECF transporter S component [Clostridia bacterium]